MVLIVQTQFQGLLAIIVQRQQIVIIVGSAMQDPAVEVNGGINQPMGCSTIFGLHVKRDIAEREISVVAEHHAPMCSRVQLEWLCYPFDR